MALHMFYFCDSAGGSSNYHNEQIPQGTTDAGGSGTQGRYG